MYVAFDVLYRLLCHLQYDVQYVRNFTDVDDKIIARAAATGEDPLALSARFITEFHRDMQELGCLEPTVRGNMHTPRVMGCGGAWCVASSGMQAHPGTAASRRWYVAKYAHASTACQFKGACAAANDVPSGPVLLHPLRLLAAQLVLVNLARPPNHPPTP